MILTMHAVERKFLIVRLLYVKVKEGFGEQMKLVWGLRENILGFGWAKVVSLGIGRQIQVTIE